MIWFLLWCAVGIAMCWWLAIETGPKITVGDLLIILLYGCFLGPIALLCAIWLFGRRRHSGFLDRVVYRRRV